MLMPAAVMVVIVLGSIAVLTKRRAFWVAGIAACLIGLAVTGSAYLMAPHHGESPGHVEGPKDVKPGGGAGH